MESVGLYCGPQDPSVLYLQGEHIARRVWAGEVREALECRRYENKIWDVDNIHPRVIWYIGELGFGGLFSCGQPRTIDHYLITALVERRRPETHTFHLPVGEATVTLQDVEVLWGLNIDGLPLTALEPATERGTTYWISTCLDYLGFIGSEADMKVGVIKASTIAMMILRMPLGNDEQDYIYLQRARAYVLLLIGGLILADASGNKIPLFYLKFLIDTSRSASYSWGSAALACLYHNLCEAACDTRSQIGGPLVLLQLWAWERIPVLRPEFLEPPAHLDHTPCARMWTGPTSATKAPQHCLTLYRDQLAQLHDSQFIWQPYETRELPDMCNNGSHIWLSTTYLICWHLVEPHLPCRVLRQFGRPQPIVPIPERFHPDGNISSNRRGQAGKNWEAHHRLFIEKWNDRAETVWTGVHPAHVTDEYMSWYRRITVSYIAQPGVLQTHGFHQSASSHTYAIETLARICHFIQGSDSSDLRRGTSLLPSPQFLLDMAQEGLRTSGAGQLIDITPSQRTVIPTEVELPQRRRRQIPVDVGVPHDDLGQHDGRRHSYHFGEGSSTTAWEPWGDTQPQPQPQTQPWGDTQPQTQPQPQTQSAFSVDPWFGVSINPYESTSAYYQGTGSYDQGTGSYDQSASMYAQGASTYAQGDSASDQVQEEVGGEDAMDEDDVTETHTDDVPETQIPPQAAAAPRRSLSFLGRVFSRRSSRENRGKPPSKFTPTTYK